MKLIIKKSDRPEKEYKAVFKENNKIVKTTYFGDPNLNQYVSRKGKKVTDVQRDNYISRHKKDLDTGDSMRAGYLSLYILWSYATNSRSIRTNIKDFKDRFGYT